MVADTTMYDTTVPSAGSLALAHEKILRLKSSTTPETYTNVTGDINNLNLGHTQVTVQREVYGTKGAQSQNVVAHNFAPTFDVEVVRDPDTKQIVAAQAWVLDLIDAAFSTGEDNKRTFQIITDALDERRPAFEGKFSVAMPDGPAGYADKGVVSFALTNDGTVEQIANPIAAVAP